MQTRELREKMNMKINKEIHKLENTSKFVRATNLGEVYEDDPALLNLNEIIDTLNTLTKEEI